MRIKLLGTAAGGGFPQWNCDCPNCRSARAGEARASPGLQCCVAVGDDQGDSLVPRRRLARHPSPSRGACRGERADLLAEALSTGSLLPSADLDQTLGLFVLREGEPLRVFATPAGSPRGL